MTDCSFYNGTLDSISALLWYLHTITLYPKGNNVDSIDEIIEVQNVESSIGNRMATEIDLALMYLEIAPTERPARVATSYIVEAIITPPFLM